MSTIITDNPYTFTVADNMNINAVFENDTCRINAYCFNARFLMNLNTTQINATGSGDYTTGSSCTVNFTGSSSSSYNYFVGWYDFETGEKLSTSKSYTFTVSKSQDLYAVFGNNDSTSSTQFGSGSKLWSVWGKNSSRSFRFTATDINGNTQTQTGNTTYSAGGGKNCRFSNLPYIPDTKYLSAVQTGSIGDANAIPCETPFNLIYDENNRLLSRGIMMNSFTDTYDTAWIFGPRQGSTIYIDNEFPFESSTVNRNQCNVMALYFTQHTAPNFNIKLNLATGVSYSTPFKGMYVPSDGVGYDNDWLAANFTYPSLPTINRVRMR